MVSLFSLIGVLLFQSFFGNTNSVPNSGYLVRNFTVQDGLPVNSVWDIEQDKDGYLYFATLSGLVRYDGYDFVTFNSNNTPGIVSERFLFIEMGSNGDLWLVSEGGFVTRYQQGRFKTFTQKNGLPEGKFRLQIIEGRVWVVSPEKITFYDENSDSFLPHNVNNKAEVGQILSFNAFSKNDFHFFDEKHMYQWHSGELEILISWTDLPIESDDVTGLRYEDGNILWILHRQGFIRFDTNELTVLTLEQSTSRDNYIYEIYPFRNRTIISNVDGFQEFGPSDNNLIDLFKDTQQANGNSIKKYEVWKNEEFFLGNSVYKDNQLIFQTENYKNGFIDRDGSIWIATDRNGLYQLHESLVTNINKEDAPGAINIYPIVETLDGSIWTGSLVSGISQFRAGDLITHFTAENSSLPSNLIRYIYEDTDSSVYIAPYTNGLWKYENNEFIPEEEFRAMLLQSSIVEAMHRDHKDRLLIGTQSASYVKIENSYYPFEEIIGIPINEVRVIRESKNGSLFFGTGRDGMVIICPDNSSISISEIDGLSSNIVRDIYVQSEDTLWIATENKGLNRLVFDKKGGLASIFQVKKSDGLISNSLHRIIQDHQETLWINSNDGIMAISLASLNSFADGETEFLQVSGFDESNGMLNREGNGGVQDAGILTSDNEIWFPNQQGITVIDLDKYYKNRQSAQVLNPIIQTLTTQDSTIIVSYTKSIVVGKKDRNLLFKFTTPNFVNQEREIYRYRLSGVNDRWQTSSQLHEANYTNLAPGDYTFDVQTIWENGQISQTSLAINIPPFFYETGWFKFLVACSFLGMGFMLYRMRVHQLKLREQELERRVKQQTLELEQAADEKSRFFSGITHELKTPLSLILGPLDDFLESQDSASKEKLTSRAQLMHRNGYRLKNLVDQILDVSKLKADAVKLKLQPCDIVLFTRQISGQFQSLLDQKGITLIFQSEEISDYIYIDKDAWERIVINLISNAIKFSNEGSNIELSVTDENSSINMTVKDYGKGISKENQSRVFDYLYQADGKQAAEGTGIGLYLVKGLTERMGGWVTLKSKENEGAEFTITLKKGYEHFHEEDYISHEVLKIEPEAKKIQKEGKIVENGAKKVQKKDAENILIVEDNMDFRTYLETTLSEHYEVHTAENGKQGLELIKSVLPDLVISDVMMPVMNGFEFVSKLREQDRLKSLPVIFLSAKDQALDMQEGLSTGADVYLSKPIRSSTLLSQIKAVLRRERVLKQVGTLDQHKNEEPELVKQLREIIFRQLANPSLSAAILADALFMSRAKLYRQWGQVSEISINEFVKKIRFDEAKHLIQEQGFSISDTARAVGFTDQSYFSTSFKKEYGYSPSELNKSKQ